MIKETPVSLIIILRNYTSIFPISSAFHSSLTVASPRVHHLPSRLTIEFGLVTRHFDYFDITFILSSSTLMA